MLLSSFLTVSALAGLALAATEEYRAACKAVETVISNASNVYYPGETSSCRGCVAVLMRKQAIPCISKGSTTSSRPVNKIPRAWSNPEHRRT